MYGNSNEVTYSWKYRGLSVSDCSRKDMNFESLDYTVCMSTYYLIASIYLVFEPSPNTRYNK